MVGAVVGALEGALVVGALEGALVGPGESHIPHKIGHQSLISLPVTE